MVGVDMESRWSVVVRRQSFVVSRQSLIISCLSRIVRRSRSSPERLRTMYRFSSSSIDSRLLKWSSDPSGTVRPEALKQLEKARIPTDDLRSRSWDEFARTGAPTMHSVFTVCDHAAKETCPLWPGQPMTAHWGVSDPASVQGEPSAIERAFRDAFFILARRISLFLALPAAAFDRVV